MSVQFALIREGLEARHFQNAGWAQFPTEILFSRHSKSITLTTVIDLKGNYIYDHFLTWHIPYKALLFVEGMALITFIINLSLGF